jgi:NitT/TauT family transport system substrate-binding protein
MKVLNWAAIAVTTSLAGAASAETVKITNIGHGYFSGALYVAVQEKLFQKHGLEPEVSYVQGGPLALQSVLTKQADVGILSYEHVLTAAVQGKRIVSFFNIANRPVNNVIASDKLTEGSDKLSVADKVKKLKGQRVAMPSANGSGGKMLGVLAKKYGLTLPGDISAVYLGAEAPSYVAAFQKDLIDAALPFEPAGVLVQQAGKGKIFLNMMNGEIPEFRDILFMTLATHPDVMKRGLRCCARSRRFSRKHKKFSKTSPSAAWQSWPRNIPA